MIELKKDQEAKFKNFKIYIYKILDLANKLKMEI